jgi:hypothetical protein
MTWDCRLSYLQKAALEDLMGLLWSFSVASELPIESKKW